MRHVFAAVGLIGMAATTLEGSAVLRLVEDTHTTQPAPQAAAQGSWTADARPGWTDDTGQRRWQFNLRDDRGDSHWGFGIRPSEIEGLPAAAADGTASDVRFSWTREAGTFRFTGSFDRGRGSGRYVFTPAPAYLAAMQGFGYRLSGEDAVRFAVLDVTTNYVRELADAGYRNLAIDELTRLRIHRVSGEQIRQMRAIGYDGLATDIVAGPATGGALLAHTIAGLLDGRRALSHPPCSFAPFTPGEGKFTLRSFYAQFMRGKRVLLADDVRNTGKTFERCARLVTDAGGTVLATVQIFDRCEAIVDLGVPNYPLVEYRAPENYAVADCPMCKAGQPITAF